MDWRIIKSDFFHSKFNVPIYHDRKNISIVKFNFMSYRFLNGIRDWNFQFVTLCISVVINIWFSKELLGVSTTWLWAVSRPFPWNPRCVRGRCWWCLASRGSVSASQGTLSRKTVGARTHVPGKTRLTAARGSLGNQNPALWLTSTSVPWVNIKCQPITELRAFRRK